MKRRQPEPHAAGWPPKLLTFAGWLDIDEWRRQRQAWNDAHPDNPLPERERRVWRVEEL